MELAGVIVRLSTDNKPYWCDGTAWTDLTATSSAVPGGATKDIQYNNAGSFGGSTNAEIDNGDIQITAGNPVTPVSGKVKLFCKSLARRQMLATVGPAGLDVTLQPAIWRQKIAAWNPPGSATTIPGVFGANAPTAVGTATSRAVAVTNILTRCKRLGYVSTANAGALCGHYTSVAQYTLGNGAGLGGFFYSCRFGFSDAAQVASARSFIGLSSTVSAPTNVEPNTLLNSIGVAKLSGDNTQLYWHGSGTTIQSIGMGTNFPPTTGILYDLIMYSPPAADRTLYWMLEKVGTGTYIDGSMFIDTTLPLNTVLLAHRAWRCNNTTGAAVGLDLVGNYIETDY